LTICEPATLTAIGSAVAGAFSAGGAAAAGTAAVGAAGATAAATSATIFGLTASQLALVSAGVSAVGGLAGAYAKSQQSKAEATIASRNAGIAQNAANDAVDRGDEALKQHFYKVGQLRGQQRAALASNGVDVDFGSAADLQIDTTLLAQADAVTISENAQREADSYRVNAMNYRAQSATAKSQARATLVGGVFDAGKSILGGVQQVSALKTKYGM
jgi:hypothetical protein